MGEGWVNIELTEAKTIRTIIIDVDKTALNDMKTIGLNAMTLKIGNDPNPT